MSKKDYSLKELVQNPSFQRMVKGNASDKEINYWNSWIEECEQNRAKTKHAIAEIAGFEFDDPDQANMNEEWNRLYDATSEKFTSKMQSREEREFSIRWIYQVAAILVLGGIVGTISIFVHPINNDSLNKVEQITQERTIRTDSDEEKSIRFNNGSKIVMNENSTVTYRLGLINKQTIEVLLEGEAYFVSENDPTTTESMFTIHTPDGVIRDIGTKFLVSIKDDRSSVVLQEGRVMINTKSENDSEQHFSMQEGEMLEFNKTNVISKRNVNTTFLTSWATGSMQFNKTTIREFADFVEQRFEVEVVILDPNLANIKIDGGIYYQSLKELVRSVSEIAKFPIYQSNDRKTIFIGDKVRSKSIHMNSNR